MVNFLGSRVCLACQTQQRRSCLAPARSPCSPRPPTSLQAKAPFVEILKTLKNERSPVFTLQRTKCGEAKSDRHRTAAAPPTQNGWRLEARDSQVPPLTFHAQPLSDFRKLAHALRTNVAPGARASTSHLMKNARPGAGHPFLWLAKRKPVAFLLSSVFVEVLMRVSQQRHLPLHVRKATGPEKEHSSALLLVSIWPQIRMMLAATLHDFQAQATCWFQGKPNSQPSRTHGKFTHTHTPNTCNE